MPKNRDNITRIEFHDGQTQTLSSGLAQLALLAVCGAASQMVTSFEYYRVSRFSFRLHPNTAMTSNFQAMAYIPEAVVPSGATGDLSRVIDCALVAKSNTMPSSWITVNPRRLEGSLKWYKANADSGDVDFENQGILDFSGTGAETVLFETRGVIEFKNPIDSALALAKIRDNIRKEVIDELKSGVSSYEVGGKNVAGGCPKVMVKSPVTPKSLA